MKIDKRKWNRKSIGGVCQLKSGNSNTNNSNEGTLAYVKVSDMNMGENEKYITVSSKYVEREVNVKSIFPIGSVIFPKRGGAILTNKVRLTKIEICCDLNIMGVYSEKELLPLFLYYYFKNIDFREIYDGTTIPQINNKNIAPLIIKFPPLSEQEAIATELNTLQSLITQYREQLNDYDKLAQSIFHEMFGDVVINEKGWTYSLFHELFSLRSGDGLTAKQQIAGDFLVYGGNGINGSHIQYNKDGEYIIIGRVGAYCGNVRYVSGKFWLTDNAFELKEKLNPQNKYYLQYLLRKLNLGHYAHKAAQPVISNAVLKDIPIPLPPLLLQQQFASCIESIEAQKVLIKQQLADAQTLFDSRMQYYFD